MTRVLLRPVTEADLDSFDKIFQSSEGSSEFQWFGYTNTLGLREQLSARALLGGESNMLTLTVGGDVVGRVEWLERRWGRRDTSLCWEIAIGIFPAFRGQGIGTDAQSQLVDYLFTHTRVERVQATTDPENVAERTCLERIGFTFEGTVRRAQWRNGAWHNQLLYSMLRSDRDA